MWDNETEHSFSKSKSSTCLLEINMYGISLLLLLFYSLYYSSLILSPLKDFFFNEEVYGCIVRELRKFYQILEYKKKLTSAQSSSKTEIWEQTQLIPPLDFGYVITYFNSIRSQTPTAHTVVYAVACNCIIYIVFIY